MTTLPNGSCAVLLGYARSAIAERLGVTVTPPQIPEALAGWLDQPGASFVTLTLGGRLRGCIGSLHAVRSLKEDVCHNARAAAFGDPRFAPLRATELDAVRIEVSVLSAPEPLAARDESEAIAALRPGRDGVILSTQRHRATFLPQVWKEIPDAHEFLVALRRKAGLPGERWSPDTRLQTYTVNSCQEES